MRPFRSIVIPLILATALPMVLSFAQTRKETPRYKDSALPIEQRVDDLLSRMTLEEKIGQLQCTLKKIEWGKNLTENGLGGVGPLLRSSSAGEAAKKANEIQRMAVERTRLGIPVIIHDEALHGLVGKEATSFPQAIGLAATWDTDLMARIAAVIGQEARRRGIRQVLSPVVNVARDVRWGRVEETYGEDPYLSSRMGVAFCKNIEGAGVVTTPKHFVVNHGDGGRDSNPVHSSERELREVYFPPFKACFQEGNAWSVMAAYNALDDVPCSSNKWLLTDILRKEWGFKGFVVSDYGSVSGIMTKHFVAATGKDAARQAVEAGLDMELPNIDFYGAPLTEGAREGTISREAVDDAARNILRAKFNLGLFENPYVDAEAASKMSDGPLQRSLARKAACEAIVLLKNEKKVLPLRKDIRSIAVIGPKADAVELGGYSGFGIKVVTPLEGIKGKLSSSVKISYEKGCDVGFASLSPIPPENLIPAAGRTAEHGLRGEYFANINLSGSPALVRVDKQVHFSWEMGSPDSLIPDDHFSVRWSGKLAPAVSGTYTLGVSTDDGVRLYVDGKLVVDSWFDRGATQDVVTLKLEAGHQYDIRMEYYENEGWSYASLGWELTGRDIRMQAAVDAAKKSDVAVVIAGIIEGEGYDRADLDLPGKQEELIKSVASTGTPTIVVLVNGSAVTMKQWINDAAAIVEAWYGGEEGGAALADVLFGDYNPAGRLAVSFPQFAGQVPLYYNYKPTGRGYDYTDMSGKPEFPFGYGLSYTTFAYSNLRITPGKILPDEKIRVTVDVENSGDRAGDEVVQLYVHHVTASVTTPLKELKGFKRVGLHPKEKRSVVFELTRDELSVLGRNMKWIVEPGTVEVMVGGSSEDVRSKSSFEVLLH